MISRGALLLLLALLLVAPQQAVAAEAPLRYSLQAELDYPTATATVQQRVTYVNRTGARLTSLAFDVTPIHFGAFNLTSATVEGQPVQPTFADVTMELPLPAPLELGARVEVLLSYRLKVPAQANLRFGRANGVLALGNWHPTAQIFKAGRWTRYRYTDVGDAFFAEAADYDVTLTISGAPAGLKIAHGGELVSQEGNRWTFRGRQVRDFAVAMSERYQTRSQVIGGTTVTVFYLPEHAAAGAQMLRTAVSTLIWANETLGTYPYSSLHVAETMDWSGTGQEYPNVVFIGSGVASGPAGDGSYLAYVVAHEVIHQWFYALVGNDQVAEPWLDEAPTTHLSYLYLRATAPDAYRAMWANLIKTHQTAVATWGDKPLDSSIYDFPSDSQYFALLYRKGALFLDELRQQMGDAAYLAMLRDYVAAYRHGIATTADLLRFARSRAPDHVPSLARRYFSEAACESAFGAVASPTAAPSPTLTPAPPTATPTPATATPSPTATTAREPSPTATATSTPLPATPTVAAGLATPTPAPEHPSATPTPATSTPTSAPAYPAVTPTVVATVNPDATPVPQSAGPAATPTSTTVASTQTSSVAQEPLAVLGVAAVAGGLAGAAAYAIRRRRGANSQD